VKSRAVVIAIAMLVVGATATVALAANLSGDGTLVGTTGNDNIAAGNGDDTVWGLGGSDNISAGNGNDVIDAGGKCPPGVTSGVYPHGLPGGQYCQHGPGGKCGTVNIAVAGGGSNGGDDTIWGNCGPNNITVGAGMGNDTIYGYGGPNNISVGNGDDKIYAYDTSGGSTIKTGTGNDFVYAQNGKVDTITCGSKATSVYADRIDKVSSSCTVKYASHARDLKKASTKRTRHHARKARHTRKGTVRG
jgi:Ca2+-binding RTX toxin-like protein